MSVERLCLRPTLSSTDGAVQDLFLVAPDAREEDVRAQLRRPAFSRVTDLAVRRLLGHDARPSDKGSTGRSVRDCVTADWIHALLGGA